MRALELMRSAFIVPMVMPPVVVALIWKILFTPDISILDWTLGLLGLPQPAWLADPRLALWAIIVADVWEWFPFVMLMLLAALQMLPAEAPGAGRPGGGGGGAAACPPHPAAVAEAGHRGRDALSPHRQRQGVPPHLHHDGWGARDRHRGDELLRVPAGVLLYVHRLLERRHRGDAHRHLVDERDVAVCDRPGG